jgi:hypothetical protein
VTPAEMPQTRPEELPTVATVVLLLVHIPPATVFVCGTHVAPHMLDGPDIPAGRAFTVISLVVTHPVTV